jgi:uncharacterized protein (TIRG00374 family)
MKFSPRKLLVAAVLVVVFGFLAYRSWGMLHLGEFSGEKLWRSIRQADLLYILLSIAGIYACYALRSLRWQVFQRNLGRAHFWSIYRMTLAGFSAVFLLGRAGEPIRPLLLARNAKHPVADVFGIWVLERLFDAASTAVIAAIALIIFNGRPHPGESAGSLETAARTTGSLLALGVVGAIGLLIYLRLHGSALLESRLEGWPLAGGWRASVARIFLGFLGGIQTIRSWADLGLSVFYSAAHWYLVVVIYFFVSKSFGGSLAQLSVGDCMLVLAFTMVGSAVQLPGVGGGSQVACFLAYTAIFGVEKEPAAAAAILVWLITFAACSFAGIPLLIHAGVSLGKLRELAAQEKEELQEIAAASLGNAGRQGDAAE